jgi:hypothetical protein
MKSAFELAMARFGGDDLQVYTPEQKEELAEVDRRAEAKIAQARIRTEQKLKTLDPQAQQMLREDLALEIKGINDKRERDKGTLRARFDEQRNND